MALGHYWEMVQEWSKNPPTGAHQGMGTKELHGTDDREQRRLW